MVLTPRSAEACLKHGVNPEILRLRDLDRFVVEIVFTVSRGEESRYARKKCTATRRSYDGGWLGKDIECTSERARDYM